MYACDHAWVGGVLAQRVVLDIDGDRITRVRVDAHDWDQVRRAGTHLPGVTLPGLVNAHSHAFHRALRGRTHCDGGTFWTWREQMYRLAAVLDPDSYHALAQGVFAEMLLAGITTVGEFHYLHHAPGGTMYDDPNEMGEALIAAADDVGIRITLLDTVYLTARVADTIRRPGLDPVQRRFTDGDVAAWANRVQRLDSSTTATAQIGAAIHSVRAVPVPQMSEVAAAVQGDVAGTQRVLHAHVAEQPAEVQESIDHHGRRPVGLLSDSGALDANFTAVHAVWLDDDDVGLLGQAGAGACICPTTERDLADGIAPADQLVAAGVTLSLGTDQHAASDLLEEARAVELNLRLATQRRGNIDPATLLDAATRGGATSLGWSDAGRIGPGALADLCVIGLDSPRLAGLRQRDLVAGVVFGANAADVTHTMVGGQMVVTGGTHESVDVAEQLRSGIGFVDALTSRNRQAS